jgi:hypothetical protein
MSSALVGEKDDFDVALFEVADAPDLPPVSVVGVNRDVTRGDVVVDGCWAVGYPEFQEIRRRDQILRETKPVRGVVSPLANLKETGLLSLEVTARPKELPEGWAGMSGAAVFAGSLLLGVVVEHAPDRGTADITFSALERLVDPTAAPTDAAKWCARLGLDPGVELPRLPQPPRRREPPYKAKLRAIRRRTSGGLVGRVRELDSIEAFAQGSSDAFGPGTTPGGYLWLEGEPWAGKTALLAEAVHLAPDHLDVVAFFVNARESQVTQEQLFTAVIPQLAFILPEEILQLVDPTDFLAMWEAAVQNAEEQKRHLLLVVDGLDESPEIASILPDEVGAWARVLVSSRAGVELNLPDPPHPLLEATPLALASSEVGERVRDLAQRELKGLLAPGADASLAYKVLGALAAAGGALSADDLAELAGTEFETIEPFVAGRAQRSLQASGDAHEVRYEFRHRALQETCREHPAVGDIRYWRKITEWADTWAAKGSPPPGRRPDGSRGTPKYLFENYPGALAGATNTPSRLPDDHQRLAALVKDRKWVRSAVAAVGTDHVLGSLSTAIRLFPGDPVVAATLRVVQCLPQRLLDREAELEDLIRFCAGAEGYQWWQGPPWAGKTALVSWFALYAPEEITVVSFFISAGIAGQADSAAFHKSLIDQLAAIADGPMPIALQPAGQIIYMLERAAERVRENGGVLLLLIVDALDEDLGAPPYGPLSIAASLPAHPLEGVRIVVTSRQYLDLPIDVPSRHPLRDCSEQTLQPSSIVMHFEMEAIRDLRSFWAEIDSLSLDIIGYLTAAGRGLTVGDLVELTEEDHQAIAEKLEQGNLARLLYSHSSTKTPGDPDPEYLFAHEALLETAEREIGSDISRYRDRINELADAYAAAGWPDTTPRYLLRR